jgi:hypothetical protein
MFGRDLCMMIETKLLKEYLGSCINIVYLSSYRRVLNEIIKRWRDGDEKISYYWFYKDGVLKSRSGLRKIFDTLIKCGYITYESKTPSSEAPVMKKIYKPTPMGVIVNIILKLLNPEEIDVKDENIAYSSSWMIIRETIYERLPYIYDYLVLLNDERKKETRYIDLLKGFITILYLINILFMKAVIAEEMIGRPVKPNYTSKDLLKILSEQLREDMSYLNEVKKEFSEKSVSYKIIEYIQSSYDLLKKSLEM